MLVCALRELTAPGRKSVMHITGRGDRECIVGGNDISPSNCPILNNYGRHVSGPPTMSTFTSHKRTTTPHTAITILLVIAFSGRVRISHATNHARAKIISVPIIADISVSLDLAPTM
jgi:hypothetical protein